jgi:hypothetical protein
MRKYGAHRIVRIVRVVRVVSPCAADTTDVVTNRRLRKGSMQHHARHTATSFTLSSHSRQASNLEWKVWHMSSDNNEAAKLLPADGEGLYAQGALYSPSTLSKKRSWEVAVRSNQMMTATFTVLRRCYCPDARTTSKRCRSTHRTSAFSVFACR